MRRRSKGRGRAGADLEKGRRPRRDFQLDENVDSEEEFEPEEGLRRDEDRSDEEVEENPDQKRRR